MMGLPKVLTNSNLPQILLVSCGSENKTSDDIPSVGITDLIRFGVSQGRCLVVARSKNLGLQAL